MITNSGKDILSKYLLGQVSSYATHIAIGCGAKPLDANDPMPSGLENKQALDFEMLRVPISSRGFVNENGVSKIALTAELPTENRYEITEVGLWSAASNTLARGFDSRVLFDFQESWQAHDTSVSAIPFKSSLGIGFDIEDGGDKVFTANSGDPVLEVPDRIARGEGPRFLTRSMFVRGDSANITSDDIDITSATSNGTVLTYLASNTLTPGDSITITACGNELFNIVNATVTAATPTSFSVEKVVPSTETSAGGIAWVSGSWIPEEDIATFVSKHIHLNNVSLNIERNSPTDEIALAFSVIDKLADGSDGDPEFVKILVEFFRNETISQSGYARAELYVDSGQLSYRYNVINIRISDLIATPDFDPSQIRVARIFVYAPVLDGLNLVGSDSHYICLDGIRVENLSTANPLYKLVGYSPIRTAEGNPIVKFENSNNYIEFRFGIGVT